MTTQPLTYQELIQRLQSYWAAYGCVLQQPFDLEVGAGTMAPETFLRVLGPKPYKVAYYQPSRRPADGRYGENPNRLYKHTQLQVILKPPPADIQELYLKSLEAIGIDLREHDIKFEEDNWESPTLGAWGIGWQVMLDGLEITQFTYFQQCGGVDLDPISVELTYGMERIAAFLQDVDSIYEIVWARDANDPSKFFTYGDVRLADELQMSVYNFEAANVDFLWKHFDMYELEAKELIAGFNSLLRKMESVGAPSSSPSVGRKGGVETNARTAVEEPGFSPALGPPQNSSALAAEIHRYPLLGAFELTLKCSHLFNLLDARGAISVTERVGVIARIRQLAVGVAKSWVAQQEAKEPQPETAATGA
jgi:glycyl-tRNA synthetase alpha chain